MLRWFPSFIVKGSLILFICALSSLFLLVREIQKQNFLLSLIFNVGQSLPIDCCNKKEVTAAPTSAKVSKTEPVNIKPAPDGTLLIKLAVAPESGTDVFYVNAKSLNLHFHNLDSEGMQITIETNENPENTFIIESGQKKDIEISLNKSINTIGWKARLRSDKYSEPGIINIQKLTSELVKKSISKKKKVVFLE